MAGVSLIYKGQIIAELDSTGKLSLKTAGKYCEADIGLSYVSQYPRADQTAVYNIGAFFSQFAPTAAAVEITE